MFRYSTIAAALILVGSVAAASAGPSHVHRSSEFTAPAVTQIDQNGDYVISRSLGAVPGEPGAPNVWR
jgi:hypothetical protein